MIQGVGASTGVGIGNAIVLPVWEWNLSEHRFEVTDAAQEYIRVEESIRCSKAELIHIQQESKDIIGNHQSSIFDAHLAILEDPNFINEIQFLIERQHQAAEIAVKEVIDKFVNMFHLMDNDYMKERASDILDVGNRVLKHLLHVSEMHVPVDQPFILVAKEITPSQLAHLNPANLLGLVTAFGGVHSHVAIISRAMNIPYVHGIDTLWLKSIQNGDALIVDGEHGIVYINPESSTRMNYQLRQRELIAVNHHLLDIIDIPTQTADRRPVNLLANIHSNNDIAKVIECNAAGVGLFRTEYIFADRKSLPSEQEQFDIYKHTVLQLQGRSLVIRTLDIGGDKQLDYLPMPKEDNPFLGYRAIRISLHQTDMFITQLKAILRASAYGPVKLMYPMITTLQEVQAANQILEQAKADLHTAGIDFDPEIQVGITIEVPAAALIADLLAEEVDFFSIGTNDLVQYVLAVDRMNESIAHMYDPFHPAIIRLLKSITDAARRAQIPISVCGELAGDIRAIPIWLGLGINEWSVSMHNYLKVKHRILHTHDGHFVDLMDQLLTCRTSKEIHECLEIAQAGNSHTANVQASNAHREE